MNTVVVSLIVAVGQNGVIGRDGKLPWRMPSDLKTFRRLTMGKPIVMGRKTYQSIGKPLDGRDNIVISRDPFFTAEGITVFDNLPEALILARALARTSGADEVMVIGGADVFDRALPLARRVYRTTIAGSPEGNVFFAPLAEDEWSVTSREALPRGPKDEYEAVLEILERSA